MSDAAKDFSEMIRHYWAALNERKLTIGGVDVTKFFYCDDCGAAREHFVIVSSTGLTKFTCCKCGKDTIK